jgi:hypothetical protein
VANAVVYVWFVKKVASGVAVFSFKRRERESNAKERERKKWSCQTKENQLFENDIVLFNCCL